MSRADYNGRDGNGYQPLPPPPPPGPPLRIIREGHVEKLPGWIKGHKDRYGDTYYTGKPVRQRFVIPAADVLPPEHVQRKDETQTQWLTRCYFAFRSALQGGQP